VEILRRAIVIAAAIIKKQKICGHKLKTGF
jgi:hypothetical protein